MTRYAVEWAIAAREDLGQIAAFIATESLGNAIRVVDRIERLAQSLVRFPNRGRIVPELLWHGIRTHHELIRAPWRLVYRIDGSTVYVVAIVDGRRDLEALLLDRLAKL